MAAALDLNTDTLTNTGTLKATDSSILELTNTGVTNTGGTVTVDALSTLDLNGGDSISGGTLGNSGLLDATGTNGLHGIALTNASGATLESTGGVLTIDGSNTTFNNVGLLEANGGGLDLNNDTLTNTGTLKATDTSVLELTSTTVQRRRRHYGRCALDTGPERRRQHQRRHAQQFRASWMRPGPTGCTASRSPTPPAPRWNPPGGC